MIATDDFVFAHLPKAGGVFLQDVIRGHFGIRAEWSGVDSHFSLEDLPAAHRGKPVFAVLRNPWAWYVSWFAFCREAGDNEEFQRNYVPGDDAFGATVARLLAPNHSDPAVNAYMREHDIGLLEMHRFHILDLECDAHDIHYGRLEHLQDDFPAFLQRCAIPVPDGLGESLAGPPRNTSRHGPWREAYSDTLRELVRRKERRVIQLGGYRFEAPLT